MRKAIFASVLAVTGLSGLDFAAADPNLTSEQIVKHFVDETDLGAKRGLCIGTTEECSRDQPAPAGLDMLINFDLDSAELTEQARANLDEFAKALKDDRLRSATFVVEGYTDASGDEGYNDRLSERRAQAVTAFLLANGIQLEKVEAAGRGESNPRVADPYDPVNRRVEMRIKIQ
ncbi:OmpA family protein [Kumtagia ephedrae]|jgi:outer membrane protein OmpA-like peptidoglycan-associated protein|uniref:Flagellar motor protein MotB n=1 Tax=Kumtagia ephedrae TaxID=2116701 RepID=A0A2P7S3E2_9HYPH|nr:OmpA family protein [Mesorhizobium ephedrae]PSJ56997.1 flagellar motor protein MotB [Mesorhizobium ephedrae]